METIKYATVCCFMLALLDEVENIGEETRHIRTKCKAYIAKHPKHLDIVANSAWEVACTYTKDSPIWNPAITLVHLWQAFVFELKTKVKLNPKYGEKLANRQQASLNCRMNSKRIADDCIKAINKVLYDNKEVLV